MRFETKRMASLMIPYNCNINQFSSTFSTSYDPGLKYDITRMKWLLDKSRQKGQKWANFSPNFYLNFPKFTVYNLPNFR